MARKPEVQQPLPSVLVTNYNNVLNIVDQALQTVSEALLQQMLTIKGKPRHDMKAYDLNLITKSLLAIKMVYRMERPLPPPAPKAIRPMGDGAYEEWVKEQTKQ